MFPIYVQGLTGGPIILEVDHTTTIAEAKKLLSEKEKIPMDSHRWIFAGKSLEGRFNQRTMRDFNIQRESTIHLILRLGTQYPDEDSTHRLPERCSDIANETEIDKTRQAWEELARAGNFDADLHLVDPDAYYAKLDFIERHVVEASEFAQFGGIYSVSNHQISNVEELRAKLPGWLSQIPLDQSIESGTPMDEFDKSWRQLQAALRNLTKTYCIVWQVLESFRYLRSAFSTAGGFNAGWMCRECKTRSAWKRKETMPEICTGCFAHGPRDGHNWGLADSSAYFSFLLLCPGENIAELKQVSEGWLCNFHEGIETVIGSLLNGDDMLDTLEDLRDISKSFMEMVGLAVADVSSPLVLVRAIALFLDLALVSYAGSHGSRFNLECMDKDVANVSVDGLENGAFNVSCNLGGLACLDGFLNGKKAWVFQCSLKQNGMVPPNSRALKRLSILTTMEAFADVWGPVYAVTSIENKSQQCEIKHFEVAKGAIVPLQASKAPAFKNAIRCHWYNSTSYYLKKRLVHRFSKPNDILLSANDLLLIGGPYRYNSDCTYTMDNFEADFSDLFGPLGTKPSEWETETRGATIGFSKIASGSFNVGQKKMPGIPLKQAVRNRWRKAPESANPAWLNHALGVEISSCTGNARRISVKELLLSKSLEIVLEIQRPGWTTTRWGSDFLKALDNESEYAIVQVWIDHFSYRKDMAALVLCVLDLLDGTGLRGDKFKVAFLHNHQEWAVGLSLKKNNWAEFLMDSDRTASYSIMADVCLECEVPNHSTSTCTITEAKSQTVLQTQITTTANLWEASRVKIDPQGANFRKVDVGGPQHLVISPENWMSRGVSLATPVNAKEMQSQMARRGKRHVVFIRSSSESHGGMKIPRDRTRFTLPRQGIRADKNDTERDSASDIEISHTGAEQERHLSDEGYLRVGSSSNRQSPLPGGHSPYPHSQPSYPSRHFGLSGENTPILSRQSPIPTRPFPSSPPSHTPSRLSPIPTWNFPPPDTRPLRAPNPNYSAFPRGYRTYPENRGPFPDPPPYQSRVLSPADNPMASPNQPYRQAARVYTYINPQRPRQEERQAAAGAEECGEPSAQVQGPHASQILDDPRNYALEEDEDILVRKVIEESMSDEQSHRLRRQPHFSN